MLKNLQNCNPDLTKKYNSSKSFKKLMDQNQQKYCQRLQESIYTNLSYVNPFILQTVWHSFQQKSLNGSTIFRQKKPIIFIYSKFQSQKKQDCAKLFLYFINQITEPKKPYTFVYVNSTDPTKSSNWSNIKSFIFEQLPLKYFEYMERLICIRPSFLDKASSLITFGVINKFINQKCQFFDTLPTFLASISFKQAFASFPKEVQQQEKVNTIINQSILQFINKINQNHISENNQVEQKKIQKQPQNKINKKGKNINSYETGELGIPLILQLLLYYFTHEPSSSQRCQKQGLFRKCSSIDDQNQLIVQMQKQNYQILSEIKNDIAVASVLKKFLTSLDPPLIPYKSYQQILLNTQIGNVKKVIKHLPLINYMTLMQLLQFFKKYIIPKAKQNLMNQSNVAICIAPCLMRKKQLTLKDIAQATANIKITKQLLEHFQSIFGQEKSQNQLFKKTSHLHRANSKRLVEGQLVRILDQKHNQKHQIIQDKNIQWRTPSFGCPLDFLKPASSFMQQSNKSHNGHSLTSSQVNQYDSTSQKSIQIKQIYPVHNENNLLKVQPEKFLKKTLLQERRGSKSECGDQKKNGQDIDLKNLSLRPKIFRSQIRSSQKRQTKRQQ